MILKTIAKFHGVEVDISKIKESIRIILNSNIKYEFRTTVYPKYISESNLINIAKYLKSVGSKKYVLQNYYDYNNSIKPYSVDELEKMRRTCERYIVTRIK